MNTFRFFHLSDFHFANIPTAFYVRIHPNLDSCCGTGWGHIVTAFHNIDAADDIALHIAKTKKIDFILLTGDLATTGYHGDLDVAFRFIDSPLPADASGKKLHWRTLSGFPSLNGSNNDVPIVLMPGNHDRFKGARGVLGFPGGTGFDDMFGDYWPKSKYVRAKGFKGIDGEDLIVICVDFTLRCSKPFNIPLTTYGTGRAYKDRLRLLEKGTIKAKQQNKCVIWAMHFAPKFKYNRYKLELGLKLKKSNRIIKLAKKHEVKHIFCGHSHQHRPYKIEDINIYCAGASTLIENSNQNTFHYYEIKVSDGEVISVGERHYVWKLKNRHFVPDASVQIQEGNYYIPD